jgi:toxin ParE1/3/4
VKPLRIAPPASEELTEAVRWYEGKRTGLGDNFYDAVLNAVGLVRHHPEIGVGSDRPRAHRRLQINGFPYELVYRERTDDLYIIAIAHTSRRPGFWKQR